MISSGVLLPNIVVIIILHVQCLSILNYPIFFNQAVPGDGSAMIVRACSDSILRNVILLS